MPAALALVVTRRCDLECAYCPVEKGPLDLSPEAAVAAVRHHANAGGTRVRVTGGEPSLVWPTVLSVIEEVASLRAAGGDLQLELCSNGLGLDETQIRLLDQPWIHLVVSVDGTPTTQRSSGRAHIPRLEQLLALDNLWVTQTIPPDQAGGSLDNFLYLWALGARRFNLLPVYYRPWSAGQLRALDEGLQGIAEYLAPRLRDGEVQLRNLERRGSVPLFNDDTCMDADGRLYRTNLVLADSMTGPLLAELRGGPEAPPLPPDLRRRLEALLPAKVRRSNGQVDACLRRFVATASAAPRPRAGRGRGPTTSGAGRAARVRPRRLEFHLSYTCTNRCVFCSEADRLERWCDHPVSADDVRKTLQSHARAGGDHVLFTGGEPTEHPAFLYALETARQLGLRTCVGTNGARLAVEGFAARALPLLDELSLSLHGSGAELHDRCSGRPGSHAGLLATHRNARERVPGLPLAVNTVVSRLNFEDLPAIVVLCARLDIQRLLVSATAPEGRAVQAYGELAVPLPSWRRMAPELTRLAEAAGMTIRFFGLPLCVLGSARMKSNDLYYDARVTVERSRGARGIARLGNVATRLPRRGRCKTRRCRGCRYRDVCGGLFRVHVERFGDDGIEAIHG